MNYYCNMPYTKILFTILLFFNVLNIFSQESLNYPKAEKSVVNYMKQKHADYYPISFNELFVQSDPKYLENYFKIKGALKYSIIHTYKIGDNIYKDVYFHLDKNYRVIGVSTDNQMNEALFSRPGLKEKLDSIEKTIIIR